jgi:hypothetical protein
LEEVWNRNWRQIFKNYFFTCCLDATHRTPGNSATTDDKINDFIGKWFRNSTDRKGGRKKREKHGNFKKNSEEKDGGGSESEA